MRTPDLRRLGLTLAAPLLAIVFATVVISAVLLVSGDDPLDVFETMIDYGQQPRSIALSINLATTYYLSAVAVAIGFRMNLFNIGVDGQYRMAAMAAAIVGGSVSLPAVLHVTLILLVAVLVGAFWAGIAGLLRATRGVSEVISTIMLNSIATGLVAWFILPDQFGEKVEGSNVVRTTPIEESGQVPGIPLIPDSSVDVYGLIVLAVLVGVGYAVLLNRTVFGFNLRATGRSEPAARASGVNVTRMIVATMIISGIVAGLVGMPMLLGQAYTYSTDFPAGIGFTGIAIALVGRNHPVGIAFGALLWGFLEQSAQILDLEGIAKEIVLIMQGTIVISVVVAYELVRRYQLALERRSVGRQLGTAGPTPEGASA